MGSCPDTDIDPGGPHPLADFDRRVSIFGMIKSCRNVEVVPES